MISRLSSAQHSYVRSPLFLCAALAITLSVIALVIAVVQNAACGQETAGAHQAPLLDRRRDYFSSTRVADLSRCFFAMETTPSVARLIALCA